MTMVAMHPNRNPKQELKDRLMAGMEYFNGDPPSFK
jgi:hypothetical protein